MASARCARASPPSPLIIPTVPSAAATLMSAQNTRAPSRANATAVALPLPQPGPIEPAPTTSATLPLSRSAMSPLVLLQIELAQLGLEDFAVVVLRQRVDEHVLLRPLEAGDAVEAERVEFAALGFADDIGDHDLAPFRVGPADHRDFAHPRMLEQHLLDLARIDVGAA